MYWVDCVFVLLYWLSNYPSQHNAQEDLGIPHSTFQEVTDWMAQKVKCFYLIY